MNSAMRMNRLIPILVLFAFILVGCMGSSPQTGSIVVTSEPDGAHIFLDGEDTGETTPATLTGVRAGGHDVTVELDGYESATQSTNVRKARTATVEFKLNARPPGTGSIIVTSEPEGAQIFLDGEHTGEATPATLTGVPVGARSVTVELDGYESATQSTEVQESHTEPLKFVLVPIEPPIDEDSAIVTGRVMQNRGGSPLAGASVHAFVSGTDDEIRSTKSDDGGFYTLYVDEGTYDIVANYPNHAQAKRQALTVQSNERATSVDLISKQIFMPGGEAEAPTLAIMLNDELGEPTIPFAPGTLIEGPETVTILADSRYPLTVRHSWVGHREHVPDATTPTLALEEFWVPGDTYLRVAVYDVQENWTEIVIPFTFAFAEPGRAPEQVHGLDLIAFTYGSDLGLYREQRREMFDRYGLPGDPDLFDIGDGTTIDLSTIRDDTTVYTVLRWDEVDGAEGYEIERASAEYGPWELVGKTTYRTDEEGQVPYRDFAAGLQPGRKAYYRIRGIGENGERGQPSAPLWVEPLPRYEVLLGEPVDDAVDVSLTPTFGWTHTDLGADLYLFEGFVSAVTREPDGEPLTDFYTWIFEAENTTEITYGEGGFLITDLKPAKKYSWNIDESRAIKFYRPNSTAVSLSGPDIGATNGEFTFTTVNER